MKFTNLSFSLLFLLLCQSAVAELRGGLWTCPPQEMNDFLIRQGLIDEGFCGADGIEMMIERGCDPAKFSGLFYRVPIQFQDGSCRTRYGMAFTSPDPSPFLRRHEIWHALYPHRTGCEAEIQNLSEALLNPRVVNCMSDQEMSDALKYLKGCEKWRVRELQTIAANGRPLRRGDIIINPPPLCPTQPCDIEPPFPQCGPPQRGKSGGCPNLKLPCVYPGADLLTEQAFGEVCRAYPEVGNAVDSACQKVRDNAPEPACYMYSFLTDPDFRPNKRFANDWGVAPPWVWPTLVGEACNYFLRNACDDAFGSSPGSCEIY